MNALIVLVFASALAADDHDDHDHGGAEDEDVHGHGHSLCGCEKDEPDHPFTIDCSDAAAIRAAYATLQACEVDGEATTEACEAVDENGVKGCQAAFFVLQAHHDYCSHDTLTPEEEEYVHAWESSCIVCAIERQYNPNLMDCPRVNCQDTSVIDAAYWIVNTTCVVEEVDYEWAGSFLTPGDSYTWYSQPVGDASPYAWADSSMKVVFIAAAAVMADEQALEAFAGGEGLADTLMMNGPCSEVTTGDTIPAPIATGACYTFTFPTDDSDFTATIDTTGVGGLAIFAQHVPVEFERTMHYLKDAAGADVEPQVELGGGGQEHAHRRRLGAAGSCCNNDHQIGAFKQIVAYHDLCDHDDIPTYVELGLHNYEEACEDHFCNAVLAGYDGSLCPSPPSPPSAPTQSDGDSIEFGVVVAIAVVAAVLLAACLCGILFLVMKEKEGKPIFNALTDSKPAASTTKQTPDSAA